jgi:aspartate aminotransferase-like enzyme
MFKKRLFAPGPTMVPSEVLLELARPVTHHRTAEFRGLLKEVNELLKYVYQTSRNVYSMTGSGSLAMEAAVGNVVGAGEKMLAVVGGKFGERWEELGHTFGANVITLNVEWGTAVDPQLVADTLKKNPDIVAVYVTHSETSTATAIDLKAVAEVVGKTDAVLAADCITSIGAMEMRMDAWGVDIPVTGSQKALMLPPGLAFLSCSEKAMAKIAKTKSPVYYANIPAYEKNLATGDTPYTPANTLIQALKVALDMIKAEGLEAVWAGTSRRALAMREAAKALGLTVYSKSPSDAVTAISTPEGIDAEKLAKTLANTYGLRVAGGQGKLKGKIVRFSHMGYVDDFDTLSQVAALERALSKDYGVKVPVGAGVATAQKVLAGA